MPDPEKISKKIQKIKIRFDKGKFYIIDVHTCVCIYVNRRKMEE